MTFSDTDRVKRSGPKLSCGPMRLFAMLRRTAAVIIGALLVMACSPTPDRSEGPVPSQVSQSSPSGLPPPSTRAFESPSTTAFEWNEPASYEFTLDSRCGERLLIGRFRVAVRDHAVVGIEGRDSQGRTVGPLIDPNLVPTLAELLQLAKRARAEGADEAVVEFDADGNPASVRIDRDRSTIDDEECYTISNVVVVVHAWVDGAVAG